MRTAPATGRSVLPADVFRHLSLCHIVSPVPQGSRICARRGSRRQITDSHAGGLFQSDTGRRFLSDRCARQSDLVRRKYRGASAAGHFRFLSDIPVERQFTFHLEKNTGKSAADARLVAHFFRLCGRLSTFVRQNVLFFAHKKSASCGKMSASCRKKTDVFADK